MDRNISAQQLNEKTIDKRKTIVVNHSNQQLDDDALRVLEKGLSFSIAPNRILVEKIICSIENAITTLPKDIAEEIRQECAVILRKGKPRKRNITKSKTNRQKGSSIKKFEKQQRNNDNEGRHR